MAVVRAKSARQVGRYQLVYELGQSYLGPLWATRAEAGDGSGQLAMLRLVSLAQLDADTRVRLLEAAWQAMEVRHDRIAAVSDVVASDGELGVLADYAEGLPLRSLQGLASVRRKPFPAPIALAVLRDLIDAAAAMQKASVELGDDSVPLYGGLSADSLFVGSDGRARVLDVAISAVASTIESLGGHAERLAYAAPEQLGAQPRADARTDVFTVGVLAWELLSNRRLFIGSDKGVAQKVLTGKIPRLEEVKRRGDPDFPEPLALAIARALERDPAARFGSVEELGAALRESGAPHAEPAAVAEYVDGVAEGALHRIRDALKSGFSSPRTAVPASPMKPKPTAVVRAGALPSPFANKPKLPEGKPGAGPFPGKPALPMSAVGASVPLGGMRKRQPTIMGIAPPTAVSVASAGALTDVASAVLESVAPTSEPPTAPAPGRGEPATAAATEPANAADATRIEQPTAKPPAPEPPPPVKENLAATRPAPRASDETPPARTAPSPEPEARAEPPESVVAVSADFDAESIPPDPNGEDPTGQYDARTLLQHVEAMDRKSDVLGLRSPPADPPTVPPRDAAPPSGDFPEPPTAPRRDSALAAFDAASGDGMWLDAPESSPRPAKYEPTEARAPGTEKADLPQAEPAKLERKPAAGVAAARVDPAPAPAGATPTAAGGARSTERAPARAVAPASSPPPSFLPSQVPPPLIHDPRANRATARPASGHEKAKAKPAPRRSILVGVLVSAGLIGASAAVATVAMRSREPAAAPAPAPEREEEPRTEAVAEPARAPEPEPEPGAKSPAEAVAADAGEPASADPPASAIAAKPAPSRSGPRLAAKAPPKPAKPAAKAVAPAAKPAAPAPKRPAPKKKRYVPSDI